MEGKDGPADASRLSFSLALLALTLFFFVVGARWIWVYRHGQPHDGDEATYLGPPCRRCCST
jgi:cbb3-type cytochrome oxidase subunit 3